MLALVPGDVLALESGIVLHSLPNQNFYRAFSVVAGDEYRLNKTSFWVLEKINDGIEWNNLKNTYLETFDVSGNEGENDLTILISNFMEQNIIRRSKK